MLGHSKPKTGDKAKAETAPSGPALYIGLDPPFVTNFEAEQLVRFLQITVQLMSRDRGDHRAREDQRSGDPQ